MHRQGGETGETQRTEGRSTEMFRQMPDPVIDSIHAALDRLEATSPIKYNAQGVFAFDLPIMQ
jgi:hypothetical protein